MLKGGNLLDLVFNLSGRSSIDVDFSISDEFESTEQLRRYVEPGLFTAFAEEGFKVFDIQIEEKPEILSDSLKGFWGGYRVHFKIIELDHYFEFESDIERLRRNATIVGLNNKRKFRIDISKHEYCKGKECSELDGCTVFHYSAEMAVFEKLRSLCQQMPEYLEIVKGNPAGRARDYFDIHILVEEFQINFEATENHRLVQRIFDQKKVPVHLIGRIGDEDVCNAHRPSFVTIQDTVKSSTEIQPFDFYVDNLVRRCESLKPLWNI